MIDFIRGHQPKIIIAVAVFIGLLIGHRQIGRIFVPGPTKQAPPAKVHRKPVEANYVTCDRFVSPNGSDSAAGTVAAPFKSGQKLVNSLTKGQTGCFRSGTTSGPINVSTPNLTLTSYPGERGTVKGRIWSPARAAAPPFPTSIWTAAPESPAPPSAGTTPPSEATT